MSTKTFCEAFVETFCGTTDRTTRAPKNEGRIAKEKLNKKRELSDIYTPTGHI
jgi:hypothetical protein